MDEIGEKIEMAARLESRIGDLYQEFSKLFPQDRDFWWQLALEEKNHSSILESGRVTFTPVNTFPEKLVPPDINELRSLHSELDSAFEVLPTYNRATAFQKALELENCTVEYYYQQAMDEKHPDSYLLNFQELNRESGKHVERIQAYVESQGIDFSPR